MTRPSRRWPQQVEPDACLSAAFCPTARFLVVARLRFERVAIGWRCYNKMDGVSKPSFEVGAGAKSRSQE